MKIIIFLLLGIFNYVNGSAQSLDLKIKERKIDEVRKIVNTIRANNSQLENKKFIFIMAYKPYEKEIVDSNYFGYIGIIDNDYNLIEFILVSDISNNYKIVPMPNLKKCFGNKKANEIIEEKLKFEKIFLSIHESCNGNNQIEIRDPDMSHSNLNILYLAIYDENNVLNYEGSFNAGFRPQNIEAKILDYPFQLFFIQYRYNIDCFPLIKEPTKNR